MINETQNMVVCKICEKLTRGDNLVIHSSKCKETAEIREKYHGIKTNLLVLIDNAYTLKNQLNTSVAIQKSKMQHIFYQDESSGFIDSPISLHHKRKPQIQISYLEDEAIPVVNKSYTPQQKFDDFSSEHKSEEYSRDLAGNNEFTGIKKHFHFDFVIQDEKTEIPIKIIQSHLQTERRGSLAGTPVRKIRLEAGMSIEEKYNKIHDEFNKSALALKQILHYGKNLQASLEEIGEEDATREVQIKNEINLLYSEILDKKISEYLKQFLKTIQEYITVKRNYYKKESALERLDYEFENGSNESANDESKRARNNPRKKAYKRYATLVDCFHTSELGEESSDVSVSEISNRKDSAANIPNVKNIISIRNQLNGLSTLSRFATSKKQDEILIDDTSILRKNSRNKTYKQEESRGFCKPELKRVNSYKNRFIRTLDKNTAIEPLIPLRKYSGSGHTPSNFVEVSQKPNFGTLEKDIMKNNFVKLGSRQPVIIKRLNDDSDRKTESTNSSNACTPKMAPVSRLQQSNFKVTQPSKPLLKRRFSLDNMRNLEDINGLLNKKFPSLRRSDSLGEKEHLKETVLDHFSKETPKSKKEEETKKQSKKYKDLAMKGYYSDSTLDEARSRKSEAKKKKEVGIEDFEFLKMIGQGAFGRIYLVRKKATGDKYAMKIVDLADNETTHNKIRSLQAEKDVYASIKGDWVVKALYTFTYKNYVCFALEYMPGGDFIHILEQVGCFEESIARFYFAELVLAVESLHALGIVHRDLKPDNILIDANGHLKLTDFGLSEKGVDTKLKKLTVEKRFVTRPSMRMFPETFLDLTMEPFENELKISQSKNLAHTNLELPESVVIASLKELDALPTVTDANEVTTQYPIQKKKNEEEVIFAFLGENFGSLNNNCRLPTHTKLDRGLSTKKKEVYRIVGTPDYMAPEIIRGENYQSTSVDLWSLGVILYEFLVGIPPFNAETVDEIFENIKQLKIEWPSIGYGEDEISPEAVDLIKKLLNPVSRARLTIRQIKNHQFFKGFDWPGVKLMVPPMVPPKKEDNNIHVSITLKNIFNDNIEEQCTKGRSPTHINDFNMKRLDLLHQLNQQTYDTLRLKMNGETEAELTRDKIECETISRQKNIV